MVYPVRPRSRCLVVLLAALFLALVPALAAPVEVADGRGQGRSRCLGSWGRSAADAWGDYEQGRARRRGIVRDNGGTAAAAAASQVVVLNQTEPEPIIASVEGRCEGVRCPLRLLVTSTWSGADGTLWGQSAAFDTGTHDWQQRQVMIVPSKPVRQRVSAACGRAARLVSQTHSRSSAGGRRVC